MGMHARGARGGAFANVGGGRGGVDAGARKVPALHAQQQQEQVLRYVSHAVLHLSSCLCRRHMLLTAACAAAAAAPSEAAPAGAAGADAGDAARRSRRSSDACARSSSGVSICTFVPVKQVN